MSSDTHAFEPPATSEKVLIVGIGNEIRHDDAVGLIVAETVRQRLPDSRRYTVKPLSAGGWQLLHEIEGYDRLVVVDAYRSTDCRPGRVRVRSPDEIVPPGNVDTASAHLLSIPDALRLSRRHGYRTPSLLGMVTIDIGDTCLFFGIGLSAEVAAAVGPAVEAVFGLLDY